MKSKSKSKLNKPKQKPKSRKSNASRPRRTIDFVTTSAPAAIGTSFTTQQPIFNNGKTINVRHRELIADLSATGVFETSLYAFPINPGMDRTFPWLSTISKSFEKYQIKNLSFEIVSRVGTSTFGSTYMFIDYDPTDLPPNNAHQMAQSFGAVVSPIWQTARMPVDMKRPSYNNYFVRAGTQERQDLKTYDIGILYVHVDHTVNTSHLCSLFVNYDIEFMYPQVPEFDSSIVRLTPSSQTAIIHPDTNFDGLPIKRLDDERIIFTDDFEGLVSFVQKGSDIVAGVNTTLSGVDTQSSIKNTYLDASYNEAGVDRYIIAGMGSILLFTLGAASTWGSCAILLCRMAYRPTAPT